MLFLSVPVNLYIRIHFGSRWRLSPYPFWLQVVLFLQFWNLAEEWHRSVDAIVSQFVVPLKLFNKFLDQDSQADCRQLEQGVDTLVLKQLQSHKFNAEQSGLVAFEFLESLPWYGTLLRDANVEEVKVDGSNMRLRILANPFTLMWVQVLSEW